MGLFDAPKGNNVPGMTPEMAECQNRLNALANEKRELTLAIGNLYIENNDIESSEGSIFADLMVRVCENAEQVVHVEKRLLFLQGKRKCDNCGHILPSDSAFCNKCGEKLEPLFPESVGGQRVCSNCGAPLQEGVMFCGSCGHKIEN